METKKSLEYQTRIWQMAVGNEVYPFGLGDSSAYTNSIGNIERNVRMKSETYRQAKIAFL